MGLDLWVKSVLNADENSNPLEIFQFQSTATSRTELSTIGPRIRINPIKNWSHFAINTTFLIPIGSDQNGSETGKPWLANDAYIWLTQFYYDQALGAKFQLFFQLAPWITLQKPNEPAQNKFEIPLTAFVSYFPTSRWSFYVQQEFWPTFDENVTFSSFFLQGGVGAKFQAFPGLLELETSYTNFYYGWNTGAGQTFNLGIRVLLN